MTHQEACAALDRIFREAMQGDGRPSGLRLAVLLCEAPFSGRLRDAVEFVMEHGVEVRRASWLPSGPWTAWAPDDALARLHQRGAAVFGPSVTHTSALTFLVLLSGRLPK